MQRLFYAYREQMRRTQRIMDMDPFGADDALPHRMNFPHVRHALPQFTELTCSDLQFKAKGDKVCKSCSGAAHLSWESNGERKALCLDCIAQAVNAPARTLSCTVCEREAANCLLGQGKDGALVICPECVFDAVMYVQAQCACEQDLGPEATAQPIITQANAVDEPTLTEDNVAQETEHGMLQNIYGMIQRFFQ